MVGGFNVYSAAQCTSAPTSSHYYSNGLVLVQGAGGEGGGQVRSRREMKD